MTTLFKIESTTHFDRLFKKLARQQPELPGYLRTLRSILQTDPYNRSGRHPIKKLNGIPVGNGQYRVRLGRFAFATILKSRQYTLNVVRCAARTHIANVTNKTTTSLVFAASLPRTTCTADRAEGPHRSNRHRLPPG